MTTSVRESLNLRDVHQFFREIEIVFRLLVRVEQQITRLTFFFLIIFLETEFDRISFLHLSEHVLCCDEVCQLD